MEKSMLYKWIVTLVIGCALVHTCCAVVDCYVGTCGGELFDPDTDCKVTAGCDHCTVFVNETSTKFIADHVCGKLADGDTCGDVIMYTQTEKYEKNCCHEEALCWKGIGLLQTRITTTPSPTTKPNSAQRLQDTALGLLVALALVFASYIVSTVAFVNLSLTVT